MSSQSTEPTVITLNETNSIQILSQYVEVAQQKGVFLLGEAEILKRSIDVLVNNVPDNEIHQNMAKNLLMQGIIKGQKNGAYTLNDAALLSKVVQFVNSSLPEEHRLPGSTPQQTDGTQQPQQPQQSQQPPQQSGLNDEDDLSDLAEPIPLKPKEV